MNTIRIRLTSKNYPRSFVEVSGGNNFYVESDVRTLYERMEKYLRDDNGSGVRPFGVVSSDTVEASKSEFVTDSRPV